MKIKKLGIAALSLFMVAGLASCADETPVESSTDPVETPSTEKPNTPSDTTVVKKVLTHEEYMAAKAGDEVIIEATIQARQKYQEKYHNTNLYLADKDGSYYAYRLPCTKEQYDNDLKVGNTIKITGAKGFWGGMHEIQGDAEGSEAKYEVLDASKKYTEEMKDLTPVFTDADKLVNYTASNIKFRGLTVAKFEAPEEGKDLYYDVKLNDVTYTFCVETDLTPADSEVYTAVKGLKAGDKIDVEGYLFFYGDKPQLHTTKCSASTEAKKPDGVLTHTEYMNTKVGDPIVIEATIQARQMYQSKYHNTNLYLADETGSYYAYRLHCTEEQYNNDLKVGNVIRITGAKGFWGGMHEIQGDAEGSEATFEVVTATKYTEERIDLTSSYASIENLINDTARAVSFKGLTIAKFEAPEEGKDLYYDVKLGDVIYTFCVETDLTPADSEVYTTVKGLKAGDKIDVEGYLFFYGDKPQLHTTKCTKLA